jgi:hypothetical protein
MKNTLFTLAFTLLFFVLSTVSFAQIGSWSFAENKGDDNNEMVYDLAVDFDGNTYIAGAFYSTEVTFGNVTLYNSGEIYTADAFVIKYDSNKNIVWAKSFGGNDNDYIANIEIAENNNIVISGTFLSSTLTFGESELVNTGIYDTYVAVLNSEAQAIWAMSFSSELDDTQNALAINSNNHIFVAGSFTGENFTAGNVTFQNNGIIPQTHDSYLAELNMEGEIINIQQITGDNDEKIYDLTIDENNNLYAVGAFNSLIMNFGGNEINNTMVYRTDMFIVRLNEANEMTYGVAFGGDADDYLFSIAVDNEGYMYVRGPFDSEQLKIGDFTIDNPNCGCGDYEMVTAKISPEGTPLWATKTGGWLRLNLDNLLLSDIEVNSKGNVFVTGAFNSVKLNIADSVFMNPGAYSMYVAEYNQNGQAIWANTANGIVADAFSCMEIDRNDNIYIGGFMLSSELKFADETLYTNGNCDIVFAQIAAFEIDWNDITLFNVDVSSSQTVIDNEQHTITLTVPSGTDLENITPYIEISEGATITPESGMPQNFTEMVVYTVTSKDGTQQEWLVSVQESTSARHLDCLRSCVIYPNPSNGVLNVSFEDVYEPVMLVFTDLFGTVIHSSVIEIGQNEATLYLPESARGIYYLKLSTKGEQLVKPIVIQ